MQLPNTAFSTDRPLPLLGTVSLGETLSAVAQDTAVTNPAGTIGNVKDLTIAREGPLQVNRVGSIREGVEADSERLGPQSRSLGLEEQISLLDEVGLKGQIEPYDGETLDGLNLRIKWRQDELKRQGILAASQQGIGTTLASFATGIGVSLIDPINIASGFVPVVAPARYASMLRRAATPLERAAVRLRVGGLEGAVGAGLVEPLVLYGADLRAADYDIYDSLFNLVAGSALGGGLHAVGGGFADLAMRRELDSVPPEVRRDAAAAGVAALAEGRKPIITEAIVRESAFKADLMASTTLGRSGPEPTIFPEGSRKETLGGAPANDIEAPPIGVPSVTQQGEVRRFATEREARKAARKLRRESEIAETDDGFILLHRDPALDVERNPDGTVNRFKSRRAGEKFIRNVRGNEEGFRVVPDGKGGFVVLRNADEQTARAFEAAPDLADVRDVPRQRVRAAEPAQPLPDIARRAYDPQNKIFAKEQSAAAQRAGSKMRPANDDIASLERDIADTVAETELMQEAAPVKADTAEIAAADEAVGQARERGSALKRAAACLLSVF